MQLKHWENLANLERSIIKEQFQKVAKQPPDVPAAVRQVRRVGKQRAEQKIGKENQPQVAAITAVTGDVKIPNRTRNASWGNKAGTSSPRTSTSESRKKNGGAGG